MRGLHGVLGVGAVVAGALATLLVGGAPAAGQEPGAAPSTAVTADAVATAIAEDGWYADPEAVGDREQLADVAERLGHGIDPMGFALLAEEPAGSSTSFAEEVLDVLPVHGAYAIDTVVVLSDADVGVVSDTWSDEAIDGALDETIDDLRADPTDGLEALADALADQPTGFDDDADDSGSDGTNTGLIVGGVVVLIALAVGSRALSSATGGGDYDDGGSSWRRRRSFYRSSGSSWRRSSSSSRSSHRSSGGSHRGRGGRRL